jgi:hypothetical protein
VESKEKLAEFLGILTGDGYISKMPRTYKFGIVGDNIKDKEYLSEYVKTLTIGLFDKIPKLTYRERALRLNFYSKTVAESLISLGFPEGKKGNIAMMDFIKKSKSLWSYFIRGIFDTDGGIFWDKRKIYTKPYLRIYIDTISQQLTEDIIYCLEEMGFDVFRQLRKRNGRENVVHTIELYGYKNLKRWRELIGSANITKAEKLNKPL